MRMPGRNTGTNEPLGEDEILCLRGGLYRVVVSWLATTWALSISLVYSILWYVVVVGLYLYVELDVLPIFLVLLHALGNCVSLVFVVYYSLAPRLCTIVVACIACSLARQPYNYWGNDKVLPQVAGDNLKRQLQGDARTVTPVTFGASNAHHTQFYPVLLYRFYPPSTPLLPCSAPLFYLNFTPFLPHSTLSFSPHR